jgi:hypothetical protein
MMNLIKKHNFYFLAVISLIAGYLASVAVSLMGVSNVYDRPFILSVTNALDVTKYAPLLSETIILSGLILVSGIGFSDYYDCSRIKFMNILAALLVSILISWLTSLVVVNISIDNQLLRKPVMWVMMGFMIGTTLGVMKYRQDIKRIFWSMTGGLMGGTFGGLFMFVLGEKIPFIPQLSGFICTSSGILLGSYKAVELMNKTELHFVHSLQNEVNVYFTKHIGIWKFHKKEKYLIGNNKYGSVSRVIRNKFIHIPDPNIKPEHVWIIYNTNRFYLRASSTNQNSRLQPLGVFWLDKGVEKPVPDEFALENDMHIKIGTSEFKIIIKGSRSKKTDQKRKSI